MAGIFFNVMSNAAQLRRAPLNPAMYALQGDRRSTTRRCRCGCPFHIHAQIVCLRSSRLRTSPTLPKVYFADYEGSTQTGLLITERIPFGVGAVEPQHGRCMDHLLDEPARHYRVIIRALPMASAQDWGQRSA